MDTDPGVSKTLLDWAAWLAAALASLLYKLGRDKAKEDREAAARELSALRESQGKMISREDFSSHEEREEKDRSERRAAEASIRDQLDAANFERRQAELSLRERINAVQGSLDGKIQHLDEKMDAKLTDILKEVMKK